MQVQWPQCQDGKVERGSPAADVDPLVKPFELTVDADPYVGWTAKSRVYSGHRLLEVSPCPNRPSGIATLEIATSVSPSFTVACIQRALVGIHQESMRVSALSLSLLRSIYVISLCI